ncbi:MAG: auxin-binding protein, partial [Caldimonas sp.]
DYPHQIINTSAAPLKYLSISTRERPEIVEYPDSGKFLAMAGEPGDKGFGRMARRADDLDYWEGEP